MRKYCLKSIFGGFKHRKKNLILGMLKIVA